MSAPRIVGQRLDWLEDAFRVVLDDAAIDALHAACRGRAKVGDGAPFTWNGWTGTVKQEAKLGRFILQSRKERIVIWPSARGADLVAREPGWTVKIEQSGKTCLALGRRGCKENAWKCAARFGLPIRSCRRRIDACVDVAAGAYAYADLPGFVTRSKRAPSLERGELPAETPKEAAALVARIKEETKARTKEARDLVRAIPRLAKKYAEHPDKFARAVQAAGASKPIDEDKKSTVHGFGDHVETITFGRGGDLSCRLYDKLAQLAHHTKRDLRESEQREWKKRGWEPGETVTRNEFQVRGAPLKELGLREGASLFDVAPEMAGWLRAYVENDKNDRPALPPFARRAELAALCAAKDADALDAKLDGLWSYLTGKWLRLTVAGAASRKERGRIDPRWRAVAAASWVKESEPLGRLRAADGASAKLAFGAMSSFLAKTGKLPPLVVTDEDGTVLDGTPREASAKLKGNRKRVVALVVRRWMQLAWPMLVDAIAEKPDPIVFLADVAELKRAKFGRSVTYYPEAKSA